MERLAGEGAASAQGAVEGAEGVPCCRSRVRTVGMTLARMRSLAQARPPAVGTARSKRVEGSSAPSPPDKPAAGL